MANFLIGENNFTAKTPWSGWSGVFLTIGFFIFQLLIAASYILLQFDLSIFAGGLKADDLPALVDATIIAILLSYVFTISLVYFIAGRRGGSPSNVLLLKNTGNFVSNLIFGLLAMIAFFAAFTLVMETFFSADAQQSEAQIKQIFSSFRDSKFLWGGIAIVVAGAPILEELIFRGFLMTSLSNTRLGFWGAAIVSSALWAAIHGYALSLAAGLFVFGLLLSFMVRRTGAIWVSIVLHAVWNAIVTIGVFTLLKG